MSIPELQGCEAVTLEEMLDAREKRVLRQQKLFQKYGGTLICLTLNIAGPYKMFPLALQTFREAILQISERLSAEHTAIHHFEKQIRKTGAEAFFCVQKDACILKQWMTELEEFCPLGRLWDIDVLKEDGTKVSRRDIGYPERRCFICSQPAAECARSRAHSAKTLTKCTISLMRRYFSEKLGERIAACAARALLYEVAVTPKPGLVDRDNNGSHADMDFFLFIDSTTALLPYFRKAAQLGFRFSGAPDQLLSCLRKQGLEAEKAMLSATRGINTHKGAIFLLGILSAAAGVLFHQGKPLTENHLFSMSAKIAAPALDDFEGVTAENAKTSGERLYAQHGITGARGEAASGFPSVKRFALPILRKYLNLGNSKDEAGTIALLYLMGNVCDSTTFHRSDIRTQQKLCSDIKKILTQKRTPAEKTAAAWQLDALMQKQGLSAGGCADLLAVAWQVLFLENLWREPITESTQYAILSSALRPAASF